MNTNPVVKWIRLSSLAVTLGASAVALSGCGGLPFDSRADIPHGGEIDGVSGRRDALALDNLALARRLEDKLSPSATLIAIYGHSIGPDGRTRDDWEYFYDVGDGYSDTWTVTRDGSVRYGRSKPPGNARVAPSLGGRIRVNSDRVMRVALADRGTATFVKNHPTADVFIFFVGDHLADSSDPERPLAEVYIIQAYPRCDWVVYVNAEVASVRRSELLNCSLPPEPSR